MHVFHIKGFSGALLFFLALLATAAVLLLLPSSFMMVLWNALVFEGFKGPEIDLYQGFLLWGMLLLALKLIFRPEIQFQFLRQQPPKPQNPSSSKRDSDQKSE
jgi:hypothetical protein